MLLIDPIALLLLLLSSFMAGFALAPRPSPRPIEHVRAAREFSRTIDQAVAESRAATRRAHTAYLNAVRATYPPAGRSPRFVRRVSQ